ncbi:hypothetical protein Kpol_495p22 [Vanderwaltozyma polyspora DSM 70294]|uniref:Uncharacterized protein n=1 Tax=Vanderwaltozyma polyspora (strain ATCC 22028 / DSM 70294 / BCRC 21397 / CBS 2163 / NBRC 10782 / NRRL Y-8283 / UCD 57-17) TaxID=436907 RepID=A7TNZ9_VANPO|nr:uncharacterized protein Kpol_495p22 [Vanderwaltozyma polyspora DSM 70294]EDO16024.1 hypothetical protein Kpol_495p22 [Vanderwaltozyma polyspora DSM 70294]
MNLTNSFSFESEDSSSIELGDSDFKISRFPSISDYSIRDDNEITSSDSDYTFSWKYGKSVLSLASLVDLSNSNVVDKIGTDSSNGNWDIRNSCDSSCHDDTVIDIGSESYLSLFEIFKELTEFDNIDEFNYEYENSTISQLFTDVLYFTKKRFLNFDQLNLEVSNLNKKLQDNKNVIESKQSSLNRTHISTIALEEDLNQLISNNRKNAYKIHRSIYYFEAISLIQKRNNSITIINNDSNLSNYGNNLELLNCRIVSNLNKLLTESNLKKRLLCDIKELIEQINFILFMNKKLFEITLLQNSKKAIQLITPLINSKSGHLDISQIFKLTLASSDYFSIHSEFMRTKNDDKINVLQERIWNKNYKTLFWPHKIRLLMEFLFEIFKFLLPLEVSNQCDTCLRDSVLDLSMISDSKEIYNKDVKKYFKNLSNVLELLLICLKTSPVITDYKTWRYYERELRSETYKFNKTESITLSLTKELLSLVNY